MDDIFKNTKYRILERFMESPGRHLSIRGIARELRISHVTVLNHIKPLIHLGLIEKDEGSLYPSFYASDTELMREYKKRYMIDKIRKDVEYIRRLTLPSCIILFGSCAKGTYDENSDIDLFVQAKETKLKSMGRIHILFDDSLENLSESLRNNILNGIILYGYVKLEGMHKKRDHHKNKV